MHEVPLTVFQKLLVCNLSQTDTFIKYNQNELQEKWNAAWNGMLLHYKITMKVSKHSQFLYISLEWQQIICKQTCKPHSE